MSITAEALNKITGSYEITRVVKEQLQLIDSKLASTEKTYGKNTMSIDLPVCFQSSPVEVSLMKTIVYSSIMQSLESRGFETKISFTDKKTILHISWNVVFDETDLHRMNAYIQSHSI